MKGKKLFLSLFVVLMIFALSQMEIGQVVKKEVQVKPVVKNRLKPVLKNKLKLPDLQITKMWLGGDCKIYIKIVNNGPGKLKPFAYDMANGAAVQMYKDRKPWGGIRLGAIDKNKVLKNPGGAVVYKWFPKADNLNLSTGINKLKAVVDNNNAVSEFNESNNALGKAVTCRAFISQVFQDTCYGWTSPSTTCFAIYGSKFGNTQGNTIVLVNSTVVQAGMWNDQDFLAIVPTNILVSGNQNQIVMKKNGVVISNTQNFTY